MKDAIAATVLMILLLVPTAYCQAPAPVDYDAVLQAMADAQSAIQSLKVEQGRLTEAQQVLTAKTGELTAIQQQAAQKQTEVDDAKTVTDAASGRVSSAKAEADAKLALLDKLMHPAVQRKAVKKAKH